MLSKLRSKIRTKRKQLMPLTLGMFVILVPVLYLTLHRPQEAEAAWLSDSWAYRQRVDFSGSTDTDKKVLVEVDTSALISDKMQSDCDDIRFTSYNGELLKYYLDSAGGACNTVSTDLYVLVPVINADTTIFMYYGNPTASTGSENAQFSQGTYTPSGGPTLSSEEQGQGSYVHWGFDEATDNTCPGGEDACDTGSGGWHGTFGAGAAAPSWRDETYCISGGCLLFDGDAYITIGDLDLSSDFTITLWFKSLENTGYRSIIAKADDYWLEFESNDDIRIAVENAIYDAAYSGIEEDKWNHAAFVWDESADDMFLYINGVLATSNTSGTNHTSNNNNLYIGSWDGASEYFNGFIDEITIRQTALSATQVNAEYGALGLNSGVSAVLGQNTASITDGLIGYWDLNEDTSNSCTGGVNDSCDSSGYGHDGAWQADATAALGKFATGVTFDGTGDYILMGDTSAMEIPVTESVSLAAWFKSSSASNDMTIVGKNADDINHVYKIAIRYGAIRFNAKDSGYAGAHDMSSNTGGLRDGTWHHVVATYNPTKNLARIYIDGVLDAEETPTNPATGTIGSQGQGNLTIGGNDSGGSLFDGQLDEVRVYSTELSPADVKQLYNWAPGPEGYWSFNENGGTAVNDSSTYSYGGTMTGGTMEWVRGKYGSALDFERGDTEYVDFTSGPDPQREFTIMAWINPESINGADQMTIAGTTQGSGDEYTFDIDTDGTVLLEDFQTGRNSTGTVSTGVWTHVAVVYRYGGAIDFYINGILDSSSTSADTYQNSSAGFAIGARDRTGVDQYFDGLIDEVKYYNYARTNSQIVEDMNGGHPIGGSPVGSQLSYWSFNEGYGQTLNDKGSDGADAFLGSTSGTDTNDPTWLTPSSCKINSCLEFDGADNFVGGTQLPSNVDTTGDSKGTISFWAQPDWDSTTTGTTRIFYSAGNGTTDTFALVFCGADASCQTSGFGTAGEIIFTSIDGGTIQSDVSVSGSEYSWAADEWVHFAATWDDTSNDDTNMQIYINGQKLPQSRTTASSLDVSPLSITSAAIGISPDWSSAPFDGVVDEFKIYGDTLTQEEILIDMNGGASIALSTLGTKEAADLDDGAPSAPVFYFDMDENTGTTNVYDKSGNENHLTMTGSMTESDWVKGKYGSALDFDGSDDEVSATSTNLTDTDTMTLMAWINPRTGGVSDLGRIISLDDDGGTGTVDSPSFMINDGFDGGDNALRFEFDTNGTNGLWNSENNVITFNEWQHVAVTYDNTSNSNDPVFYVNGIRVGYGNETTPIGTPDNMDGSIYIGNRSDSAREFDGVIDEVKMFAEVLTPAQIWYEFNRGKPLVHFKMDECQGATIYDSGPDAETGTIVNGGSGDNTSIGTCDSGAGNEMWDNGTTGKFNSSLSFDGDDSEDYVQTTSTHLKTLNNFTVTAWINTDVTNSLDHILWQGDATGNGGGAEEEFGLSIGDMTTSSVDRLQLFMEGTSDDINILLDPFTTTDTWVFVAATVADLDTATPDGQLYVNGELAGTDSADTVTRTNWDTGLRIGAPGNLTSNSGFDGEIDDVRIYPYVLSPTELKKVMNNQAGVRFGPSSGNPE